MQSFSNRLSVTAPDQAPATAPVDRLPEAAAGDIREITDPNLAPADGHDASEDVDFDAAIAEVLMTLAADQGQVVETRSIIHHDGGSDVSPRHEPQDATSFDDEDNGDHEEAGEDDSALDPEAALAAEAATFRLLGELERLWHGAA